MEKYSGNIIDVVRDRIYAGTVYVDGKRIVEIVEDNQTYSQYIVPGFVDSHIHIESSMLVPSEFARIAVQHGTIAAVCDAHEIANVLGVEGVKFMIRDGERALMKFYFSAPSCVPATPFESSGAQISPEDIKEIFNEFPQVKFLGEMMNYPGVIQRDPLVMQKIQIAREMGKVIDGHAPALMGVELKKYVIAGISTDHECFTKEEALQKIALGMKILIREGSAVKNFDDLIDIAREHHANCAFCSDDKHPDELIKGHINELVHRALKRGLDTLSVFKMASLNPVRHYGLEMGLLQEGDPADFIILDDLEHFNVLKTIIEGKCVFEKGVPSVHLQKIQAVNKFNALPKENSDFNIPAIPNEVPVIEVIDGQLITRKVMAKPKIKDGMFVSDVKNDIIKISVINRYENARPAVAFVKNFGLKKGAIASSVAHDSHNIIVVGVTDQDICKAVNSVINEKGGICAVCEEEGIHEILPLPFAGLMSNAPYEEVADMYVKLDKLAKGFGSALYAPFMTLSFMALLVIPEIKLSDKGLFDGTKFKFINF